MSGQKIIDGLREAIAYAKSAPVIGWDIGSPEGDFSADQPADRKIGTGL